MKKITKIVHEAGNKEAWICICGNRPADDGFYPCDKNGDEIEPTKGQNWNGLYVCNKCGSIIEKDTLIVLGQNPNAKMLR